jgi:TusA-related sulfurtransferase
MSALDGETKRKLREMNAGELLEAIDTQDETGDVPLSGVLSLHRVGSVIRA